MPTLVIQLPDMPPVEHVLKDDAITIGRMKGNTIALDNVSVSLSHAKLTRKEGDYYLKDLNSTNGTMLNGQSITEARLHDGDYVKFGEVSARYFAVTATPTTQSAPAANVPAPANPPAAPANLPPTPTDVAPAPAPVAPATSAPPPAPAPVATPTPVAPATAAPSSPPATTATSAHPASAPVQNPLPKTRSARPQKKSPLVPILSGVSVVAVAAAGFLIWKFYFNEPENPAENHPVPASMPARQPATQKSQLAPTNPVKTNVVQPAVAQDVPALIEALKSSEVTERRRAASALNSLGTGARDAVPALRAAIKDSDSEVRMWAALALVNNHVYDEPVIPILIQLLQHENPVLRQVACLSLSLIPFSETEKEPVIAALTETANKDDNAEVRNAAVAALKLVAR